MVQNSVIVSGLLNDAVCNSGYVVSNDRIINDYEPERIRNEAVVLYMEVQSRYLPQGTARKPRKKTSSRRADIPAAIRKTPSPEGKSCWTPLQL